MQAPEAGREGTGGLVTALPAPENCVTHLAYILYFVVSPYPEVHLHMYVPTFFDSFWRDKAPRTGKLRTESARDEVVEALHVV